jgi:predicted RNA polymerase sigma factor
VNTDDNMLLELAAPRTLHSDRSAQIRAALARHPPQPEQSLSGYTSLHEPHRERAASLYTAERTEEALAACEEALRHGTSFEAKQLLGQILHKLGRIEEARRALTEALAMEADPQQRAFAQGLLSLLDEPQ